MWEWSPLAVVLWKPRQLEKGTSHPGSLYTQRSASDPSREGFIPSWDGYLWQTGLIALWRSLSLYRWSPPPLWRGLRLPACYKPDETNPSQSNSFQAGSVSSKDDPTQSSVSPCAISSYQEVIFRPKTLLHCLNLQNSFLILTPKLCPTCHGSSVVSPFITIYQSLANICGKK